MEKTLKDIYEYEFIENPETSLLKRINSILAKTPSQLNLEDVCTLIRQECFLEIAIPKAIKFVLSSPSAGDNYPFSLLKNLSEVRSYSEAMKPILEDMVSFLMGKMGEIDFEDEDEKELFLASTNFIREKL